MNLLAPERQPSESQASTIVRDGDRSHYLTCTIGGYRSNKRDLGGRGARFGVIRWHDNMGSNAVTLTIDSGPFAFHEGIPLEGARALALALMAAVEEFEKEVPGVAA